MTIDEKDFQYEDIKKVGSGAFGDVFKGRHKRTKKVVAIKYEEEKSSKNNRLKIEFDFYKELNNNITLEGIPKIYWYGSLKNSISPDIRNVMVMEYLGPSLEKLFIYMKKTFSLKTILMIAIQCLERVEFVHNNGIIHRDIKPDNFLIGSNNRTKNQIYIVDLGLSKKYINIPKYELNPFKNTRTFTGTYRFCSMRSHHRLEQGRRDDLESLGYMLLYFFRKDLPWQGVKEDKKDGKSKAIFKIKNEITPEELCKGCPNIMVEYIKYCRLLKYTEVPNYYMLKSLFIQEMNEHGFELDYKFDWDNIN